jgi:tetratricopeptide (TPR) repeat protein
MSTSIARHLASALVCLAGTSALAQPPACTEGLNDLKTARYMQSIQSLTACLQVRLPDKPRAFILQARARAYAELERWPAAVDDQRQSIALAPPSDVWPDVMLGAYLRKEGKLDESLAALKTALEFDEDGAGKGPGMAVYYHTAMTLHQAHRYDEAIEAATKGIAKQPDYGYAFYQRALSYEALGDDAHAALDFSRASELAPNNGYEPEIAKKLREHGFAIAAPEAK